MPNVLTAVAAVGHGLTTGSLTYTAGASSGTVTVGDVFEIEGVNSVNYETKADQGTRKQFRVTAVDTASGGAGTLTFSPGMRATGPEQNVTTVTVSAKHIYFCGAASTTYRQDLVFVKEAFAFASADLERPNGMDMVGTRSEDGFSIRFIRGYDIRNAQRLSRLDIFFGIAALRPEWCVRVFGKDA